MWSIPAKIFYGLCIVVGSFFGTLWFMNWRDANATCAAGKVTALEKPFGQFSGMAYMVSLPTLADASDGPGKPPSTLILCEGILRLGPAHTQHVDIVAKGGGRFSHYGPALVFSASDNTDPNKNGRSYFAVQP